MMSNKLCEKEWANILMFLGIGSTLHLVGASTMGTFPVITVSRAFLVLYVAAGVFQTVESTSIRTKFFGGQSIIQETLGSARARFASDHKKQQKTPLRADQTAPNVNSTTPCVEESEALPGSQPVKFAVFSGLCHFDHSKRSQRRVL
ncbi:unnamed protein product [Calypogeia fissa]